jgi:uncharacterized protein YaiE (UPF0345 family)
MASQFFAHNGPMPTTGSYVPITTGTAVKTMLQVRAPATSGLTVFKWGLDFTGTGTVPIRCELMTTGTVGATITAFAASAIMPWGKVPAGLASGVQLGAGNSGYMPATAGAEGAITTVRYASINSVLPGNGDRNEWSLGREFYVPPNEFLRIRVLATAAVDCACYVVWEE